MSSLQVVPPAIRISPFDDVMPAISAMPRDVEHRRRDRCARQRRIEIRSAGQDLHTGRFERLDRFAQRPWRKYIAVTLPHRRRPRALSGAIICMQMICAGPRAVKQRRGKLRLASPRRAGEQIAVSPCSAGRT